jgi:hypothetical protein
MSVQARNDNDVTPFIRAGFPVTKGAATIAGDGGRTEPLVYGTVMAQIAADLRWTPFINAAATDGTAIPQGIFVGNDISAAALVAGDVDDQPILVGMNVIVSREKIIFEGSVAFDTVITVGTNDLRTAEARLASRGIFVEDTVDISGYENS